MPQRSSYQNPGMPKRDSGASERVVYGVGSVLVVALLSFSMLRMGRGGSERAQGSPARPRGPVAQGPTAGAAPTSSGEVSLPPLVPTQPAAETSSAVADPPLLREREPAAAEVVGVPRSKPEDVLAKLQANGVTLIDVRDKDAYLQRHIPGALHIPLSYIDGEVPYLPKDKPIVTYCT